MRQSDLPELQMENISNLFWSRDHIFREIMKNQPEIFTKFAAEAPEL